MSHLFKRFQRRKQVNNNNQSRANNNKNNKHHSPNEQQFLNKQRSDIVSSNINFPASTFSSFMPDENDSFSELTVFWTQPIALRRALNPVFVNEPVDFYAPPPDVSDDLSNLSTSEKVYSSSWTAKTSLPRCLSLEQIHSSEFQDESYFNRNTRRKLRGMSASNVMLSVSANQSSSEQFGCLSRARLPQEEGVLNDSGVITDGYNRDNANVITSGCNRDSGIILDELEDQQSPYERKEFELNFAPTKDTVFEEVHRAKHDGVWLHSPPLKSLESYGESSTKEGGFVDDIDEILGNTVFPKRSNSAPVTAKSKTKVCFLSQDRRKLKSNDLFFNVEEILDNLQISLDEELLATPYDDANSEVDETLFSNEETFNSNNDENDSQNHEMPSDEIINQNILTEIAADSLNDTCSTASINTNLRSSLMSNLDEPIVTRSKRSNLYANNISDGTFVLSPIDNVFNQKVFNNTSGARPKDCDAVQKCDSRPKDCDAVRECVARPKDCDAVRECGARPKENAEQNDIENTALPSAEIPKLNNLIPRLDDVESRRTDEMYVDSYLSVLRSTNTITSGGTIILRRDSILSHPKKAEKKRTIEDILLEGAVYPDRACKRTIMSLMVRCYNYGSDCDWTGELADLQDHLDQCQLVQVTCVNSCGRVDIPRNMMVQHIDVEGDCPLAIVNCRYGDMGCKFKARRIDIIQHMKETTEQHLELAHMRIRELEVRQENICMNGKFLWKITNYEHLVKQSATKKEKEKLCSPPFYTGQYGYKLRAEAFLNGLGQGKGSHLSLYVVIMKGEYDAILPWPFKQNVDFVLIDQDDDVTSRQNKIWKLSCERNSDYFKRPNKSKSLGFGCPKFVSLDTLRTKSYIKDQTLFIKIEVEPTDGLVFGSQNKPAN